MPAHQVVFLFLSLLIAGLGLFVFLRNPVNSINKRFCIFSSAISIWIAFNFFIHLSLEAEIIIFRVRLVFCSAAFIPFTFFFFSSIFPDLEEKHIDRYLTILFFSISIFFVVFSSKNVDSVFFDKNTPYIKHGKLFPLFWLYFISCMAYSLYNLYKKSINYYGIKRLQIQYVFLGVALSVFLGVVTNFTLPLLNIWHAEMYVPLVSIPIPVAVAYAIVRYHLMDISVVIKRGTVYFILTIILGGVYSVVGLFLSSILPVSEYKNTVTTITSTVITVLTLAFTRDYIQNIVEKTLFHIRYSHSKILSDSTLLFSSIHELNELLCNAIQYLYDSVGIEKICILMNGAEAKNYIPKASINFSSPESLSLSCQDAIVTWLYQNRIVLSRDHLQRFARRKSDHFLEDTMASLGVEICIPVFQDEDLVGIILLGKKINKKIFTQEDIQMFLAFSGQLAMAASNARLYMGLREAKIYRDNILQCLKNGVIVVDNDGHVTIMNSEAKRILGLKETNSILLRNTGDDISRAIGYTLKSDIEYQNIEILIDNGIKKIPCGITTTRLKTEGGEVIGALAILTDLTELKLLQAEKQHADHLARLGTLSAHIAHEIKNPLVAINTYFQLLPYKKNDEEFHNDFQKIAVKEIDRINRIIEDLLDLAKPSKPVSQAMDPCSVITDTVNFLKNTAAEKNIGITTVFEEKNCQVLADEDKIKQVLLNILQNSIEALQIHGRIEVTTFVIENPFDYRKMAKTKPGSVFFSFAPDSQRHISKSPYFVIKVYDNGTGISAEKVPHIFEPFFTDKEKGTGLGLALVYRILKDHYGFMYVESKEGSGTIFYIGLPLNPINVDSDVSSFINTRDLS